MSTVVELRKVKKRPVLVHRPKKTVNSQDKSLHRSMLSHSRIATGYKKKIAALLGNNRALAHALEMAHVELTNKDKLTIELQRRLTLQSPKRFKSKLQKVCEHLHIIVALLQDVLDDCEEFTEPNTFSFTSQTNNSRRDMHAKCENGSPLETQQHLNNADNNNVEINSTPLPAFQNPPRLTTAAEMSAILEQSVLLGDENLPPILFPEDENEVISNITTRPKSKSRSASNQQKSRKSKIYVESPQSRKSSCEMNMDNEKNTNNNSDVGAAELISSPKKSSSTKNLNNKKSSNRSSEHRVTEKSPKKHSSTKTLNKEKHSVNNNELEITETTSPASIISFNQSPKKEITTDNSVEFLINRYNLDNSQNEFFSPTKTINSESCVKRKSLCKKKSKKKILVVKLPCIPKRSLPCEDMADTIHSEKDLDSSASQTNSDRRKTFTVSKTKKVNRRTFALSSEGTKDTVDAAGDKPHSEHLTKCLQAVSSSPTQLCNDNESENNSLRSADINFTENKKGSNSDKTNVQSFNTAVRNSSCLDSQSTTYPLLTENTALPTNTKDNEIITSSIKNSVINDINSSSISSSALMYGYDPLEGTSKNKKSSILLKKTKVKSTKCKSLSKIPKIKERLSKQKSDNSPVSNKNDNRISSSSVKQVCVNVDLVRNEVYSLAKSHLSSAFGDLDNSPVKNLLQETVDPSIRLCQLVNKKPLENTTNFNNSISNTLLNHTAVKNKPHSKSITAIRTESNGDQELSSLNSVQPVVKLNDILTSVRVSSPANHCDNYVYIPDLFDGSVLKVDTTPKKNMIQSENESDTSASCKDEDFQDTPKVKEIVLEEVRNSNVQDASNADGVRKRRGAASCVSYKEPPLNKKLRQGDPFTSDLQNAKLRSKKQRLKKAQRSCSSGKSYFEGALACDDDDFESC